MTVYYRDAHGMFACNGILLNPGSARRGENFGSRQTTRGAATCLKTGAKLRLSRLEARRDWGNAGDDVDVMLLILQPFAPSDNVIGTGVSRSVRDLVELAFGLVRLDGHDYLDLDPAYVRPSAVPEFQADPCKTIRELAWCRQIGLEAMIREMLESHPSTRAVPAG